MFDLTYEIAHLFVVFVATMFHGEHVASWPVWHEHAYLVFFLIVMIEVALVGAVVVNVGRRYGFFQDK